MSKLFLPHAIVGGIISILLLTTVEWQDRGITIGTRTGNPLATAQMAGYAILAALLYNSQKPKELVFFIIKITVAIVCLLVAIRSGSRGQLLAAFIALVVFWPLAYRVKNVFGFIFAVIIFCALIYLFNYGLQQFWSDHDRFSLDRSNADIKGRFDMSLLLLADWFVNPFAVFAGLGNSAAFAVLGTYPHILLFEIIGEEGLIGLSLYALILYFLYKNINGLAKLCRNHESCRKTLAVLSSFALFTFLLSMKQGSLIGSQEFFMMTMIIARYKLVVINLIKHKKRRLINRKRQFSISKMNNAYGD